MGVIKADTRSVDYSSLLVQMVSGSWTVFKS